MFPKFLKIACRGWDRELVQVNETTTIEKFVVMPHMAKKLKLLAAALGVSYEPVLPGDLIGHRSALPNGSYRGILGMIQKREADMTFGLNPDEGVMEDFFVSFPYNVEHVTFVTKKHQYVPNPAVYLHPFSIQVWFAILGFVCIMPFIFQCLMRKKYTRRTRFTSSVGSLLGQGIELKPQRPGEYLLLAFWILGTAVLSYAYAAVLLSVVTFPSLHGIGTVEELANGIKVNKYSCETHPRYFVPHILAESTDSSLRVIGEALLKSNGTLSFVKALESFDDGNNLAFISSREGFLPYKDLYFISEESFFTTSDAMVFHKDFCCTEEVNKVMHRIWASGLYKKLVFDRDYNHFLEDIKVYRKHWNNPPPETQLTLTLLKGPFLFLIISHVLSCFVLLIEIGFGKLNRLAF